MSWPTAPLGDLAEIVSGATPKTGVGAFWDGDVTWATPRDLSSLRGPYISSTPRTITAAGLASCGATVLPAGSVMFSSRAPIGHVAINTVPMATNQGFKSFVPKADHLDAKYLFHWLRAHRPYLEGLGNGATFKEVSKAVVSRVEIPLPPLEEQRRIAAILDQADALRAKRREAIALLDDLTQSIFIDMFGQSRKERVSLKSLSTLITKGTTPTSVGLKFTDNGVPFLRVQNLLHGSITHSEGDLFIDSPTHDTLRRSKVQPRDVLTSIAGTIGRTSVVPDDAVEMNCNQAVAIVRLRDDRLRHWIRVWLSGRDAQGQIRASAVTATIANLSLSQLGALHVPAPDETALLEFNSRLGRVKELGTISRGADRELQTAFEAIQARAFSGRL